MADTPKTAFPVISEQATVRIKLGILVSLIVAVAGGAVYITNAHNDAASLKASVDEMRDWARSLDRRVGNVEEALGIPRSPREALGPPSPDKKGTP